MYICNKTKHKITSGLTADLLPEWQQSLIVGRWGDLTNQAQITVYVCAVYVYNGMLLKSDLGKFHLCLQQFG